MSENHLEGLRDLVPTSQSQLNQRLIELRPFTFSPLILTKIRLLVDPIGSGAWVLLLIAVILAPCYLLGPIAIIPIGIGILLPMTRIRMEEMKITIEGRQFKLLSSQYEPLSFGVLDVDKIYSTGQSYMFVAFSDIGFRNRYYPTRSRAGRPLYIPFSAFKSDEDRLYFESLFPEWKIKRK